MPEDAADRLFLQVKQVKRRAEPAVVDVFDAAGRSIPSMMELWPGLLALAVALNLAELTMRKGKSLFARS